MTNNSVESEGFNGNSVNSELHIPWLNVVIAILGLIQVGICATFIHFHKNNCESVLAGKFCSTSLFLVIAVILSSAIVVHVVYSIFNDPIDFNLYDIIIYSIFIIWACFWPLVRDAIKTSETFASMVNFLFFFIGSLSVVYHFVYKVDYVQLMNKHDSTLEANEAKNNIIEDNK